MATFQAQIEDLTGSVDAGIDLDVILTASAKTILDLLPVELLMKQAKVYQVTDTAGTDVSGDRVLLVDRGGRPAREIPVVLKDQVGRTTSIHYATTESPVYWLEGGAASTAKLYFKPNPDATSDDEGHIHYVTYPAVLATDSSITAFPAECEYAVVLHAAWTVLQQKLNVMLHTDNDPEMVSVAKGELENMKQLYAHEMQRFLPANQQGGAVR